MAQLVARGVWDAEVASSSLVAPTNIKKTTWWSFFMLTIICELAKRSKGWIYFIDALE